MTNKRVYLGFDVGAKRVGVAIGDSIARIAQPLQTLVVNDMIGGDIAALIASHDVTDVIVGRPRNQAGETTEQTVFAQNFVKKYLPALPLTWQDESVTSVLAEERLKARNKPYQKADIDAEAAAIILQDFLETV